MLCILQVKIRYPSGERHKLINDLDADVVKNIALGLKKTCIQGFDEAGVLQRHG